MKYQGQPNCSRVIQGLIRSSSAVWYASHRPSQTRCSGMIGDVAGCDGGPIGWTGEVNGMTFAGDSGGTEPTR